MTGEPWHLSKAIPISILVGFLCQFAGVVWMFSQQDASIRQNSMRLDKAEAIVDGMRAQAQAQAVQLGRIEASLDALNQTLERIDDKLDRR